MIYKALGEVFGLDGNRKF